VCGRYGLGTIWARLGRVLAAGSLKQSPRGGRLRHQVHAVHFENRLHDQLPAPVCRAGLHVVAQAHVLRRVFGIPQQLLRQGVLRVVVQIAV
jgi:hypothetical protein